MLVADGGDLYAYTPSNSRLIHFGVQFGIEGLHMVADGVLVQAGNGLYYHDATGQQLQHIGNTDPGQPMVIRELSDRATLIVGDKGIFRYDVTPRGLAVLRDSLSYILHAHALPNGDVLVLEFGGNLLRYDAGRRACRARRPHRDKGADVAYAMA